MLVICVESVKIINIQIVSFEKYLEDELRLFIAENLDLIVKVIIEEP